MLGLSLLQELRGQDDQSALDCLAFDSRWQYALRMHPESAYLSRRSLVDFRSRLALVDPEMIRVRRLFDVICSSAIADLDLSVEKQRIDSTLITSNIRTRSRYDLFSKTLRHFLKTMKQLRPDRLPCLTASLLAWFEREPEGWFGKQPDEVYRKRLQTLAEWAYEIAEKFKGDSEVASHEVYVLIQRILKDHCDVSAGGDGDDSKLSKPTRFDKQAVGGSSEETPAQNASEGSEPGISEESPATAVTVRKPSRDGTSLQSPYDPDAGYGHKGQGYHVQVSETCSNSGTEILTDYDVHGACPDQGKAQEAIERLEARNMAPKVLYGDAGYGSGTAITEARDCGTELHAPVRTGRISDDWIGRDRFTFDDSTGEAVACPEGHSPIRHGEKRSTNDRETKTLHAYFDRATCESCPLVGRCCARPPSNGRSGAYQVELQAKLLARDERLAEQQQPEFWEPYKIRAGIEATMSELKRTHGLEHLRVRRLPRVRLAVGLKLTACNIKRWLRAVADPARAAPNPANLVLATRNVLNRLFSTICPQLWLTPFPASA